ncbi:hypothetical protein GBA52_001674 [Prunus armeniaca]|nr:hypothetical protein GBA52_001674 [Prunus armeniaca]
MKQFGCYLQCADQKFSHHRRPFCLDSVKSLFFQVELLSFFFHVESMPSLLSSTMGCWPRCCLFQILGVGFVVLFLLGA